MQIGTKPSKGTALVYLNVENRVPQKAMDEIAQHIDLLHSWQISL